MNSMSVSQLRECKNQAIDRKLMKTGTYIQNNLYSALPIHVDHRGVHLVNGFLYVIQLTIQAAHYNSNSLRASVLQKFSGLVDDGKSTYSLTTL